MGKKRPVRVVYTKEDVDRILKTGKGKVVLPTWPTGETQDHLELCSKEGIYFIGKPDGSCIPLSTRVDVLPLVRYLRAFDSVANVASYWPTTPAFEDIAARAKKGVSGCMVHGAYLLFEASLRRYLEFFVGFSNRPDSLMILLGKQMHGTGCTLGREQRAEMFWPTVLDLATPFKIPDQDEFKMVIEYHEKQMKELSGFKG